MGSNNASWKGLSPVPHHLLVRRDAPETTTPGGIILPDTAKEAPILGTVLAVGDECPYPVRSMVMFSPYAGVPVYLPETRTEVGAVPDPLLMLHVDDVIATYQRATAGKG